MNTETFSQSRTGQIFIRLLAAVMESRLRYKLFAPEKLIRASEVQPGMKVLEAGCGTGFFTIPAARILGNKGLLIAMDILPESVELVSEKIKLAGLDNVLVVKGDVLATRITNAEIDHVLLFGVIPAPSIPLPRLLKEMYRILKPGGIMSVWPHSWVHQSVKSSGLFRHVKKANGVMNYKRLE